MNDFEFAAKMIASNPENAREMVALVADKHNITEDEAMKRITAAA